MEKRDRKRKAYALCLLMLSSLLLTAGCSAAPADNSEQPAAHFEPEDYQMLETQRIDSYDALSEDNPTPGIDDMTYEDAAVYAIRYYEQEYGVLLEDVSAYGNFRGTKDSERPSYLVKIEDKNDDPIVNIRLDSQTGELMSIEEPDLAG